MAQEKDVSRLVLELSADVSRLDRGMRQGQRVTEARTKAIERSFDQMQKRTTRSVLNMSSGINQVLGGIALGAAARQVQQYADAWTRMGNPLRAAGLGQAEVNAQMSQLVDLALRSRSSLEGTLTFYNRLTSSSKELGLSQQSVLRIVETVNKALATSSLSSGERTSAVTQLVQGLGSGNLAGDELKAIRENALPIAQAIAKEFGVGVGQLKKLGEEGKLTSVRVAKALLDVSDATDKSFTKTNATISDSFTNLETRVIQYIGQADAATGASRKLVEVIGFAAENLDEIATAAGLAATVLGGALAGRAIVAAGTSFAAMQASILLTNVQLTAFEIRAGLAAGAMGRMSVAGLAATGAMSGLSGAMAFLGGPVGIGIIALAGGLFLLAKRSEEADKRVEDLRSSVGGAKTALDAFEEAARKATNATAENAKQMRQAAEAARLDALYRLESAQATRAQTAAMAAQRAEEAKVADQQAVRGGSPYPGMLGGQSAVAIQRAAQAQREAEAAREAEQLAGARYQTIIDNMKSGAYRENPAATPDGKKGPKGKSAKTLADEAERQRRRVEDVKAEEALGIAQGRNDADAIRALERMAEVRARQRDIIDASTDAIVTQKTVQDALSQSTLVQTRLDAARLEGQQKLIKEHDLERNILLAEKDEATDFLKILQRRKDLQELIVFYQERGFDLTSATSAAASELAEIEQSRADANKRHLSDLEKEDAITMARISAVTRADRQRVKALEDQAEILKRIRDYTSADGGGLSRADALARATREVRSIRGAQDRSDNLERGQVMAKSFIEVIRSDDIGKAMGDRFREAAFDQLETVFSNIFAGILNGGGGGGIGAGIGSAISGGFGRVFGGGRALGGPVKAGVAYKINETTPRSEYFTPAQNGYVGNMPKAKGKPGGVSYAISQGDVYITGTGDAALRAYVDRAMAVTRRQTLADVKAGAPAAQLEQQLLRS